MHQQNRSSQLRDERRLKNAAVMNYLAHAYLSFNDPGILAGNMVSDFVKGRKKFDYPDIIQKGIALHRRIDEFTDDHLASRELKLIFKPAYRLYSSAILDVLYDHFLANDENHFNEDSLRAFSMGTYEMLDHFEPHFPEQFGRMFPYMRTQNWLFNYRFHEGVRQSLGGLARRAKYMHETDTAFRLFEEHHETLRAGFNDFFPDLYEMAKTTYDQLVME